MANYVDILNTIRANASADYQEQVPLATRTNIIAVGNPLLTYTPLANEFLSLLINKIAMTVVRTKRFVNPLAKLKSGQFVHGYDIEELYVNPETATSYDPAGAGLLATNKPSEFVNFHRLNRQDKFKVTIWENQLKHAFVSIEAFDQFFNSIVSQLYNGDEIAEFTLMLNTLAFGVNNKKIKSVEVTVPALATPEERARLLLKSVKLFSSQMVWPSDKFNSYQESNSTYAVTLDVALNAAKTYYTVSATTPLIYSAVLDPDVLDIATYYERTTTAKAVVTWTPKEEQILFVTSDFLLDIEMDYLAGVFNLDKTRMPEMLVEVPHFGTATGVVAILADKNLLQVYDNLYKTNSFENPEGLYTNFWLHHWQTYSLSLFGNAVAFRVN